MNFQNFLSHIQDIKKWKNNIPFWWIITYNADNIALEFFPEWIVTETTINQKIQEFEDLEKRLSKISDDLQSSNLSDMEIDFIWNIIEMMFYQIQYFKKSIYFEAEKSGQYSISHEKRIKLLDEINNLQNLVYGEEISKKPEEVKMVLDEISQNFLKKQWLLSDEEKFIMTEFFKKFHYSLPEKEEVAASENNNLKKIFFTSENWEENQEKMNDFVEIIYIVFELYGLDDWKIQVSEEKTMFSVSYSEKTLFIPKSKITTTSVFRLLQLIDHEIGVHALRGHNTLHSLKTTGPNYLDHEEWLATHSEMSFEHEISEIHGNVTEHHITTFIAENYNASDTERILQIWYKMNGSKNPEKDASGRMKRVKRFVSNDMPGANRKDVSYTRGNLEISQKLANMTNEERKEFLKDFYFAKLSLNDKEFVPYFREMFDDKNHKYPLWVGKILFKKLMWEKIFFEEFMKRDGRFVVENINSDTKRKMVEILKLLRKNISDSQTNAK